MSVGLIVSGGLRRAALLFLSLTTFAAITAVAGCGNPSSGSASASASLRAAQSAVNVDNVALLRFSREAILQNPRSPRARLLMALGLARSGNARDALFEVAIAQQLSHSPRLLDLIQGPQAAELVQNPQQCARSLLPLIPLAPE